MKKFEDLEDKVISWAFDRRLTAADNYKSQFMKFIEESRELARAILKDDEEQEKDAFGDVMVTLIILAAQRRVNLVECLDIAYK